MGSSDLPPAPDPSADDCEGATLPLPFDDPHDDPHYLELDEIERAHGGRWQIASSSLYPEEIIRDPRLVTVSEETPNDDPLAQGS